LEDSGVSRVPRSEEHLKIGFTTEAVSAARYRAQAARAEREGQPNLAAAWLEMAAEKDLLAIRQLEASGQVREGNTALADALAEERFENDILYPKMILDVDGEAAEVFLGVVEAQQRHLERLRELRTALQGATGDI
jgi:rubrerythrin